MFMKRFFSLAAALVLLAGALCAPAAACCYAQDSIADPEVAQRMEGLIPMVLEAIYGEDEPPVSTVSLDRAVRTYRISYEAFLEAVDRDILDLAWEEAGYVWKLPVYMDEETGAYALATVGGTGSSYTTSSYPGDNFGMHDYVFYPQQTLDILREAGVSQTADIYVLSLSGVKLDFVVAEEPERALTTQGKTPLGAAYAYREWEGSNSLYSAYCRGAFPSLADALYQEALGGFLPARYRHTDMEPISIPGYDQAAQSTDGRTLALQRGLEVYLIDYDPAYFSQGEILALLPRMYGD